MKRTLAIVSVLLAMGCHVPMTPIPKKPPTAPLSWEPVSTGPLEAAIATVPDGGPPKPSAEGLKQLDAYLSSIARMDPERLAFREQLAMYLNAWNAGALKARLHTVPARRATIIIGGRMWTLRQLHDHILGTWTDPRVARLVGIDTNGVARPNLRVIHIEQLDEELGNSEE